MQILGIVATASPGVVREQRAILAAESGSKCLPGRSALVDCGNLEGRREAKSSIELRLQLSARGRAGPAELLAELAQRSLVALE